MQAGVCVHVRLVGEQTVCSAVSTRDDTHLPSGETLKMQTCLV